MEQTGFIGIRDYFSSWDKKSTTEKAEIVFFIMIRVVIMFIAVILSWNCNVQSGMGLRVLYGLLAFVFPEIYIIYYVLFHTLFGFKCFQESNQIINTPSPTLSSSSASTPSLV
jgi:hypothetical protein